MKIIMAREGDVTKKPFIETFWSIIGRSTSSLRIICLSEMVMMVIRQYAKKPIRIKNIVRAFFEASAMFPISHSGASGFLLTLCELISDNYFIRPISKRL